MQRSFLVFLLVCAGVFRTSAPANDFSSKQTIQTIRGLAKGGETSLPALAKYLGDRDREIRIEAVKAIVKIDTMRSLDPLVIAVRDNDSEIQFRAIDGIVNAYVPGYVTRSSVTGYITKGVRQVKSFFTERNDTVVDPDVKVRPDIGPALAEKITGGNGMDVRSDAALAAGILRASDTVPALEQGLHSKDTDVIFESLIALQKIKDPAAGPSVDFLAHDLDDRVQTTALETLGVLRSLTSADDIRSAFKNARNAKVQRAALEALAMLGLSGDRALFQQYLRSTDPELRASALEGLGRIREPDDYPTLQAAFNEANADWRVHEAAAFAMVMEGDNNPEALGPLQYLVEGFSLKQRANVSVAYLSEVARKPETRAALGKILPDSLKDRKIGILNVLSGIGAPDSIQIIQGYTADKDRDVEFAAMRAARIAQTRSASYN
jgi:HEAT repeat protein